MTNTNVTLNDAAVGAPPVRRRGKFAGMLQRSETLRGFFLLSPTLVVMTIGIVIPFAILITMSLWTAIGFGFDTTLTTANYEAGLEQPIYGALMHRSLIISGWATVATVLLSYPMAYYVAFHVHKNKMMWIVLMTLPLLDKLPAARFRVESGAWL